MKTVQAMLNQPKIRPSTTKSLLLAQIRDFVRICASVQIPIVGSSSSSELSLSLLPQAQIEGIQRGFEKYLHLLEEASRRNLNLKDSRHLSWAALQILGAVPTNDFFEWVKADDIVECYNLDHIQTFRSLRFFELCSYDVLSILTQPWHELYGREQALAEAGIAEMVDSLSRSNITEPFKLPKHELWEIASAEKRRIEIKHKARSPLFFRESNSHRDRAGMIMTSEASRV